MEKFAVDLEKVLDEFEFSEEREERVALSVINNQSLPYISHVVPSRPPVNNYRRPSFEPINLADADFAASPPRVSRNQHNLTYSNGSIASIQNINSGNKSSNIDKFHLTSEDNRLISNGLTASDNTSEILTKSISSPVPAAVFNTVSSTDSASSITNTLSPPLSSRESIISESWSEEETSSLSDEKPDLLDCNTNKSIILNEHHRRISNDKRDDLEAGNDDDDDYDGASRLLPDVTPSVLPYKCIGNQTNQDVITLDNDNPCNKAPVFDLISNNFNSSNLNNYSCTGNTKDNEIEPISNEADDNDIGDNSVQIAEIDVIKISDEQVVCDDVTYKDNEFVCEKGKNVDIDIINNDPSLTSSSKVSVAESNFSSNDLGDSINEKYSFPQSNYISVDPELLSDKSITCNNTTNESSSFIQELKDNYDNTSISLESSNQEVKSDANVSVLVESEFLDSSKQAIGFTLNDSCDDSDELERYLEELEELEKSQDINSSVKLNDQNCDIKEELLPDQSFSVSRTFERLSSQESDSDKETLTVSKFDNDSNKYLEAEVALKSNETSDNNENTVNLIDANAVKEVFHSQIPDNIESLNDNDVSKVNYRRSSKEIDDSVNQLNSFMKDNSDNYLNNGCSISDCDNALNIIIDDSKSIADIPKHISDQCEGHVSSEVSLSDDDSDNKIKDIETVDTMGNSVDKVTASVDNRRPEDVIGTEEVTNTVSLTDDNITVITSEPHLSQEQQRSPLAPVEDKPDDGDVSRISRPNYLELPAKITVDPDANNDDAATPSTSTSPSSATTITSADGVEVGNDSGSPLSCGELSSEECQLGKVPPFWVPDSDALTCMQCQQKFTLVKRRHHCRACGQVLCSKCCCMRTKLVFMEGDAKVCQPCYNIIGKANSSENKSPLGRQPNPNNPMEYCSTIPPLQQAAGSLHQPPPSVLVPVGVLKREGRVKSEVAKQVMFSDGIRPGGDLTELDGSGEPRLPFRRPGRLTKRVGTPPGGAIGSSGSMGGSRVLTAGSGRQALDPITQSFIPSTDGKNGASLPPIVERVQGENVYSQFDITFSKGVKVDDEKPIKFAINANLSVLVKRVLLDCCVNRECWCVTSSGLACVGQDEVILVLECLPDEIAPPKDVFLLINTLYIDASKGNTVSELSFSPSFLPNLLDSKDHGGFLYVRPSYQCTSKLILPSPPYLVALLIHKWETPWARLFPIRLVLRLGAEYRYYPCPLVSIRHRQPLYTDIGHTIINILADFRKYSYTLPTVRGLVVHMEDRQTTILLPRNRYDQVVRALNNSNDSVLAFGANLSLAADSHLVCIQSSDDENAYHTQAINIHNKPRRVTGASFVVFNGALKASCGLSGKSSIVEDGLMVQVPGDTMTALRTALRDMRDYTIRCGPHAEETVLLRWTADDTNFNIGVKSCIDGRLLDGVPSMRVHNGTDYSGQYRIIRWTEVFILQCEEVEGSGDPLDISRLSESLARATCLALVPYLDLLATANLTTIGVRAEIHPDHVGYEAGSNCEKLPPLYMNSLDNELVGVVHQAAVTCQDTPCTLELVFRVMES